MPSFKPREFLVVIQFGREGARNLFLRELFRPPKKPQRSEARSAEGRSRRNRRDAKDAEKNFLSSREQFELLHCRAIRQQAVSACFASLRFLRLGALVPASLRRAGSRISNPQKSGVFNAAAFFKALPTGSRRYSRLETLETCATGYVLQATASRVTKHSDERCGGGEPGARRAGFARPVQPTDYLRQNLAANFTARIVRGVNVHVSQAAQQCTQLRAVQRQRAGQGPRSA